MKLTIIEDLKKAKPKKRAQVITAMHAKNVAFFKKKHPALGFSLETMGTANFEIRFNEQFMDIIERSSGEHCHPPGKLLDYIEKVASWHHTGWIDKMEMLHKHLSTTEHGALTQLMIEKLHQVLPQVIERMQSGVLRLPRTRTGRRFSGSTVFLGALTGLHIVHYLNTTEVRDIVIIEPDVHKFALSCWFVDYAAIERQFNRLVLHVGIDMPENPLHYLVGSSPVTASVWMRMLPIYPSEAFTEIINRVSLRWRALHEIVVSFDREVRSMNYGALNLKAGRPILSKPPTLSKGSRCAVVASGPSLEKDMEWLRTNRDKLIIFAAISCVRALKFNGITPDFQCTLDTELDDALFDQLGLDPEVPLIAYYKIEPPVLKKFKKSFLLHETNKANAVEFKTPMYNTHPTTGNLSVAVALFMRPAELFLLGLDFGFRKAARSHVSGGWHDDNQGVGHDLETVDREQISAPANFEESDGQIFTHAYYHQARATVEAAVAVAEGTTKVWNLADGARVKGADGRHSRDIELEPYEARQADLEAIEAAFLPSGEDLWSPYPARGSEVIGGLKETLLDVFKAKEPDWPEFAYALDILWPKHVIGSTTKYPGDIRFEAYAPLIVALLAEWYRFMIFTTTPAEFKIAYTTGVEMLATVMEKLVWPPDLDFEVSPAQEAA